MVVASWIDFIGDVAWAHQRLRAYGILQHVIRPNRHLLRVDSLASNLYITALLISFSNPETIIFFPWKEESYTEASLQTGVPSAGMLKVTLLRLLEDFPQFGLQVASLILSGFDTFTAINLGMTLVVVIYMVIAKAIWISFNDLLQAETGKPLFPLVVCQVSSTPTRWVHRVLPNSGNLNI